MFHVTTMLPYTPNNKQQVKHANDSFSVTYSICPSGLKVHDLAMGLTSPVLQQSLEDTCMSSYNCLRNSKLVSHISIITS